MLPERVGDMEPPVARLGGLAAVGGPIPKGGAPELNSAHRGHLRFVSGNE